MMTHHHLSSTPHSPNYDLRVLIAIITLRRDNFRSSDGAGLSSFHLGFFFFVSFLSLDVNDLLLQQQHTHTFAASTFLPFPCPREFRLMPTTFPFFPLAHFLLYSAL